MLHQMRQTIEVPSVWRPLSFQNQNGDPTIWFEANNNSPDKTRLVILAMTGDEVPEQGYRYVGTAMFGVGHDFVAHCYVQ